MEIKSTGLRLAGWTRPGSYCLGILSTARGEAEWSSRAMPSAPHGRLLPRFRRPGAPDSLRPRGLQHTSLPVFHDSQSVLKLRAMANDVQIT